MYIYFTSQSIKIFPIAEAETQKNLFRYIKELLQAEVNAEIITNKFYNYLCTTEGYIVIIYDDIVIYYIKHRWKVEMDMDVRVNSQQTYSLMNDTLP